MDRNATRRLKVLKDLAEFFLPLDALQKEVSALDPDYEGEEYEFRIQHVVSVLERYGSGGLSETDVEDWANLLEIREDMRFEEGAEEWLENIIFELANPLLTTPLDRRRAETLIRSAPNR